MGARTGALTIGLSMVLAVLPAPHALPAESSAAKAAVQVTNDVDPLRAHSSPQIAVNPTNGELVIVEANVRGDRACTTHISVDDGRSWFRGGDLIQEPYLDCTLGAEYGPYATLEFRVSPVYYRRSTDSGASFEEAIEIDPGNADADRPPVIAADPTSEAVYVAWSSHAEQRNVGDDFEGDFEIFFLASVDGGESWGDRLVLNDDGSDVDQYLPGLSIAPDGRVDVAWYDDRLNPAEPEDGLQDVFATSSSNQGGTFTPNIRITDRSIDRTIGVWGNNIDSHHNVGVASTEDETYFAWQDTRNGDPEAQAEDVYMTKLVHGSSADATGAGASRLVWAVVGAAAALLLAGIALVAASRLTSRSRQPQAA